MPRRQPQRSPLTRDIGNTARIRAVVDDQHYMIDVGSRVGAPVIGFYIGSLVLAPGERVLATWREESDLWEIIGPIRQQPSSPSGVNLAIQQGVTGAGLKLELIRWTEGGGFEGQIFGDVDPVGISYGVEFSPNGLYIATKDINDALSVYGLDGVQLDTVDLSPGGGVTYLAWSADGGFILAAHEDNGDEIFASIYSWDGSSLTFVDNMIGTTGSVRGHGVAWNLDGTVVFFSTSTAGADANAFSFDGASASNITTEDQSWVTPVSMELDREGDYLITGETSTVGNRGLGAALWNGATLGATIYATSPTADNVRDIEISPDGQWVAVAINASPFVRVYPYAAGVWGTAIVPTGADIPAGAAYGVSWHPDGTRLFVTWHTSVNQTPYYGVFDFDGVTLDNRQDGPNETAGISKDGYGIHFSKASGVALPTEQLDASEITYTPADDTDWPTVPDDVAEALDELADRLTGLSRIVDLPLGSFVAHTGSPTYAQVGTNMHAWELDAAADELVVYSFTIPPQYASGGFFRLRYVMASATTNEVVVSADALAAAEGEDFDAAGTAATVTDTVQAGASDDLGVVDVTPAVTYAVGDRVRAIVGRLGSDGDDDAAGDMWLVGIEFRYTAAL